MRYFISFIGVLLIAASLWAQATGTKEEDERKKAYLYQWTDEKGMAHITDTLGNVPEKYRSRARRIETPKKKEEPGGTPGQTGIIPVPLEQQETVDEGERKAEWRRKIRDWKDRLAEAEKRYQELEDERNTLIRKWNLLSLAPPETKVRVEKIDEEMQSLRKQINEARNMIDVVIPEQARKAGVPPGWLRE